MQKKTQKQNEINKERENLEQTQRGIEKQRQESARLARFLTLVQHLTVCTDLAAASTAAAAAATMGSFTYK